MYEEVHELKSLVLSILELKFLKYSQELLKREIDMTIDVKNFEISYLYLIILNFEIKN